MRMKKDYRDRYFGAVHAVQSGVAMEMEFGSPAATAKHLRTGLDVGKAEFGGLAKLLISKGIITEDEHYAAITEAVEQEQADYERRLTEKFGGNPVKLV